MELENFNQTRRALNKLMADNDDFFSQFGALDDAVYAQGAIPKKYKELMGLSISILTRCEECILYHIQGCLAENATKQEIVEAIKIGVVGGGSITYPSARFTFKALKEMNIVG